MSGAGHKIGSAADRAVGCATDVGVDDADDEYSEEIVTTAAAAVAGVGAAVSPSSPTRAAAADDPPEQLLSLRYNNFMASFMPAFQKLFESQSFVDVSLVCKERTLHAHKVVLSANSSYLQRLLLDNPCKHPIVIMPECIAYEDLRMIVDYMYRGEIDVMESALKGVLDTAKQLQIKGLCDINSEYLSNAGTGSTSSANHNNQRNVSQTQQLHQSPVNETIVAAGHESRRSRAAKRPRLSDSNNTAAAAECAAAAVAPAGAGASVNWTTGFVDELHESDEPGCGDGDVQSRNSNLYMSNAETSNSSCGEEDVGDGMAGGVADVVAMSDGSVVPGDNGMLGESMGYLDFAAEPAAPAATPVTGGDVLLGSVGVLGAVGSVGAGAGGGGNAGDVADGTARRLAGENIRSTSKSMNVKFQTLQALNQELQQQQSVNSNSALSSRFRHSTSFVQRHQVIGQQQQQQQKQQQLQQRHNVVAAQQLQSSTSVASVPTDTIVISANEHQQIMMQQHQQHQHHLHQQQQHIQVTEMLDDGTGTQEITIDPDESSSMLGMEVDVSHIKREDSQTVLHEVRPSQDGHMVTMVTASGDLVEMYQSDNSDDSKMTDLSDMTAADEGSGVAVIGAAADDDDEHHHHDGKHFMLQQTPLSHTPTNVNIRRITEDMASATTAAASSNSPSEDSRAIAPATPKIWTQANMDAALEALRAQSMSLTKASTLYGIPSTTLWQRAHRLGIDTPKKEGPSKTWSDDALNNALEALRNGEISANKASKAYGIPSSTLYKIARREGIRLAAPFNAAPTNWSVDDLERALESIRSGATSVQKASIEFGIPTGTLYGRCKREGIELSRSNPTPWSEENMMEALETVRNGVMSINQAAIHFNLPYSSLYGRFKRCKFEVGLQELDQSSDNSYEFNPQANSSNFAEGPPQQQPQQQQQLKSEQVVYHLKTEQS